MKKLLSLILLSLIASAQAHDFDVSYNCEEAFKDEYEMRARKSKSGTSAGGAILLIFTAGTSAFAIANHDDRQKSLAENTNLLSQAIAVSNLSREEIATIMQEEDLNKVLAAREAKRIKLNSNKKKKYLSVGEYDDKFPLEKDLALLANNNRIDLLVKTLNKISKLKVNYNQVKDFLQENSTTNYFCEDGKSLTSKVDSTYLKELARAIKKSKVNSKRMI